MYVLCIRYVLERQAAVLNVRRRKVGISFIRKYFFLNKFQSRIVDLDTSAYIEIIY